jgi:hypothetical protein
MIIGHIAQGAEDRPFRYRNKQNVSVRRCGGKSRTGTTGQPGLGRLWTGWEMRQDDRTLWAEPTRQAKREQTDRT